MRRIAFAAALLAAMFVAPATATAASACGTTAGQWLGTFLGTETATHNGDTYTTEGHIEITEGPVVGYLDPYPSNNPTAGWTPDSAPDLVDGTPSWSVSFREYFPFKGTYLEDRDYTVNQVTCSGGQVSAFDGTFVKATSWHGSGTVRTESFAVSR